MLQRPLCQWGLSALVLFSSFAVAEAGELQVPGDHARITDALAAVAPGDTVRVAAGTYAPSTNGESYPLALSDTVTLLGAGMGLSVLDAEGTATAIQVASGSPVLAGFTVTGGSADWGGGARIQGGSPEIRDCLFLSNEALRRGSGINVEGSASPWIHRNVVWLSTDIDLNHGGDPHGIQCGQNSTGIIEHNLVGRTDSNGLIIMESSAPIVRHNIFFENGIPGLRGRGICFFGLEETQIRYNLFHGNSIAALVMRDSLGVITNVSGVEASDYDPADGIEANLDGDPRLMDPDDLDFRLSFGSPAIDAGDPALPLDPDGSRADLGPFVFEAVVAAPSAPDGAGSLAVFPNPFNPRTNVSVTTIAEGPLRVEVLDPRGRIVRRLFSGHRAAGDHRFVWDGRGDAGARVASGVYLVRVQSSAGAISRPALLLK